MGKTNPLAEKLAEAEALYHEAQQSARADLEAAHEAAREAYGIAERAAQATLEATRAALLAPASSSQEDAGTSGISGGAA